VQRVQGEQRRHEQAPPRGSGDLRQQEKQEQRRGGVEKNIRQVVAAGARPNSSTSSMWESQVRGCQFDIAVAEKAQATFSPVTPPSRGVIGNVSRVVEGDEPVIARLKEDADRNGDQRHTEDYCIPHVELQPSAGLQLHSHGYLLRRLLDPPLLSVGDSQIGVCFRVIGIQRDGHLKPQDGMIDHPFLKYANPRLLWVAGRFGSIFKEARYWSIASSSLPSCANATP